MDGKREEMKGREEGGKKEEEVGVEGRREKKE